MEIYQYATLGFENEVACQRVFNAFESLLTGSDLVKTGVLFESLGVSVLNYPENKRVYELECSGFTKTIALYMRHGSVIEEELLVKQLAKVCD